MERNLSENDRQSINSNFLDLDDEEERRKGNTMVPEEMERRKHVSKTIFRSR